MIKVTNTEVAGFEPAIRGMRNPMNSWDKSDTIFVTPDGQYHDLHGNFGPFCGHECLFLDGWVEPVIGKNDLQLMQKLYKAGSEHRKYLRQIVVWMDILAPLYWWKEFDTYKIGTTADSCSTMHKIHAKEFTFDDFSHEHLFKDNYEQYDEGENDCCLDSDETGFGFLDYETESDRYVFPKEALGLTIDMLNRCREVYLKTKNKEVWWQMIQLLPSSYNQMRTVSMNYEVVMRMIDQRKDHKLDEWREFTDILLSLPYVKLIRGE